MVLDYVYRSTVDHVLGTFVYSEYDDATARALMVADEDYIAYRVHSTRPTRGCCIGNKIGYETL